MPITVRGRDDVSRALAQLPAKIERTLRGAVKVAAEVIADEARERCTSPDVKAAIKVTLRRNTPGRAVARVGVKGPGSYLAPWLEYGTSPHVITVSKAKRSLLIDGRFVGREVQHPGAHPHPFLRPALQIKKAEARAAAQAYIDQRLSTTKDAPDPDGEEG